MKVPRNVEYTNKISNCIDELLMQDTTFNQQAKKDKYAYEQKEAKYKIRQLNKNNYNAVKDKTQNVQKHNMKLSLSSQNQRVNFVNRRLRNRQNVVNVNNKKQQLQYKQYQQQLQKQIKSLPIKNNNNKKDILKSTKAQQKYRTINILNKQQLTNLRLKKTYSYEVEDENKIGQIDKIDKINQKDQKNDNSKLFDGHDVIEYSGSSDGDSHSPTYLLGTGRGDDGNWLLATDIQNNKNNNKYNQNISNSRKRKAKYPSIRDNLRNRLKQNQSTFINKNNQKSSSYTHTQHFIDNNYKHNLSPASFINQHQQYQYLQQQQQQQHLSTLQQPIKQPQQQQQFHLTHQQLQFLSLLYPNESPQQLMLKLLSYYEEQQLYNNSFQQLFEKNQLQSSSRGYQFFRTRHEIRNLNNTDVNRNDDVIQMQEQSSMYENNTPIPPATNYPTPKSNFSKLKQQCLASIGQQMVQTQIKSSLAQTVNVNYYTRQYAMPIIMETINMKNQQSQHKLLKLQESIKAKQQKQAQQIQQEIIMTLNQQKIAAVLAESYQNINSQSINIPTEFTHKVYIPANSRGQSFEMDYKPDSKLFEYITQNEYRRILRDINHLIQKVLSYHRHSSFLKRKNNSLLKGWNLALLIFLFLIIIMLCVRSFFIIESQNLQIIVFFCLSFIVILILGNSFNNYKRNVKRSSVIKDICQQLSNYLDFINSSNKNIKWVLGKDFFWLEIWIDVIKNNNQMKK